MTREEAARILYNQWQGFLEDNNDAEWITLIIAILGLVINVLKGVMR